MNLYSQDEPIQRFRGEYRFLSNFEPYPIEFEGEIYKTLEAAYQAAKTLDPGRRKRIQEAPRAGRAKWLGRHVPLRPDWEEIKLSIMKSLLHIKFSDPDLRARLLDTGDADLIEGNDWHDLYYGVCICPAHKGQGANMLGKLLMEVRQEIKEHETQ